MRDWNLTSGDPLCLTIAADARFGGADYQNDHIWELELGSGEPSTLALRTTFGLRARSMRVFPRFSELQQTVANPAEFPIPPHVRRFYPNQLALDFSPLPDLHVTAEYWVPQSQVVAGRLTIINRGASTRRVRLDLCAVLSPIGGQVFSAAQVQMMNVLTASTGGLIPLLFMTGGPASGSGPYPALTEELDFTPNAVRQVTWTLATLPSVEASFDLARRTAGRSWDAERSRIKMTSNADTIDIQTGDPDWDTAFAMTQKAALSLFFPASQNLPQPSFVQSRQPDQGHSQKGDGTDHPVGWAGQTPLEAYYLASLLPGAPHLTRGLLTNFLITQTEDGSVDLRPGLAGQRGRMLATPLLASLSWQIYQSTADEKFLAESFPKLLAFFWSWFSPAHDRDHDGVPEWDHLLQTGWEDNPLFDTWHPWSQGADVSAVDNPGLYAMLAREAACLILMAEKLEREAEVELVKHQADVLLKAAEAGWDERASLYRYRDLLSRLSLPGKLLARGKGTDVLTPKTVAQKKPIRLLMEIQTKSPATKQPEVKIYDSIDVEAQPVEVIAPGQFQRTVSGLIVTSQKLHTQIASIIVSGLDAKDKVIVRSVDLTAEDHTLFLPLWAGLPDSQRAQALVGRTLLNEKRFQKTFGIPASGDCPSKKAEAVCMSVHLPWNHLIGEGLLVYGFRPEAASLTTRLMTAVVQNLKQNRAFYARYHADSGAGIGERGALTGLAPLGLFLQTLGVTIYSQTRLRLEGRNPFPWPVTLRYRDLTVVRGTDSTVVTFGNGKSVTVDRPDPVVVSM